MDDSEQWKPETPGRDNTTEETGKGSGKETEKIGNIENENISG
jgi:hypothetical protein